jgi:trimeric autotransporter adhesin
MVFKLKNMSKKEIINLLLCALLMTMSFSCKKYYVNDPIEENDSSLVKLNPGSEAAEDYLWNNPGIVHIVLKSNSITADSSIALIEGSKVTITSSGTYSLTGSLSDGQIIVNSTVNGIVRLIFNGVNITCSTSAPVYIKNAEKTQIVLANNTENFLTDGTTHLLNSDNEPGAALFSKSFLSFFGTGSLTVDANYKDGISGKDGLVVKSGIINVNSVDDGIRGKDYVIVRDGNITINSGGDGIKSDNDSGIEYGYITIETGTLNITSVKDAIHSESAMVIKGGTFVLNTSGDVVLKASGSGYDPSFSDGISCKGDILISTAKISVKCTGKGCKGISSNGNIIYTSGTCAILTTGAAATYKNSTGSTDSYCSSCISSDGNIFLQGGSVTASSSGLAGKGIKSDGTFTIGDVNNSPVVNITTSGSKLLVSGSGMSVNYSSAKAVKSTGAIAIDNGTITISSADDGMKSDASVTISNATVAILKSVEGIEAPAITVNSGNVSIVASDDGFNATKGLTAGGTESNDGSYLTINGGSIIVNTTTGDGLDSNGNVVITGGIIAVHGPQSSPEVGMDYNGSCNISGGFLAISGTNSNMTQAPSTTSGQYSLKTVSSVSIAASTLIHIQNASGNDIVTFKPVRSYYSFVFSSPALSNGSTYYIYTGGTSTGTNNNGIYSGGVYSGGTLKKSFSISGKVTSVSF